jgi:hypothetical protein
MFLENRQRGIRCDGEVRINVRGHAQPIANEGRAGLGFTRSVRAAGWP